MKILFYIHAIYGGGAEHVLSIIVNEIVNKGYEVCLATDIKCEKTFFISDKVKLRDLYFRAEKQSKLSSIIHLRYNIRKIAKEESPDIIVSFLSSLGCTTIFSTLGLGIPVIVCEHTNVSRFLGHILNLKRKFLYPLASCITVLTRYDYSIWRNKLRNVVYLPNPIGLSKKDNKRTPRRKIILAAGRVTQWTIKGFDSLIKIWSRLCNDFPDWKLQIAGNGDDKSFAYLNNLITETACKNVEFLGFRHDVKDLMQTSEIFCLSSRVEGLPMVLIEAMDAGCCCVSFDVKTGPNEIIVNGKSGLIAKNQDLDDFTNKLRSVLQDENLRNRLAANAPSSVEKYSTERVVQRWIIMFDKILRNK